MRSNLKLHYNIHWVFVTQLKSCGCGTSHLSHKSPYNLRCEIVKYMYLRMCIVKHTTNHVYTQLFN